ncbi:MAG: phenylacetate--CoA ligase family protein [Acidimicrobiia bacterium]|nr:phenylacetate--CoA ligase family protein [Acidimicrobiia bacterium]
MPLTARLESLAAIGLGPRWNQERVRRFQDRRLLRLVRHAYENVPHYRRLFEKAGLRPEAIRGVEDLGRIPITHRSDFQAGAEEVVARGYDPRRLITHRSSGTTGEPMTMRRTWFEERLLHVFRLWVQMSEGLRPTDARAAIALHRWIDPKLRDRHKWPERFGLFVRYALSCEIAPEELLEQLLRLRPEVLQGYPNQIAAVGLAAKRSGTTGLKPRLILSGGETLTPLLLSQIREYFCAPVLVNYAAHEFNLLAYQCREEGLFHVCGESLILEVIHEGRPAAEGETGEVVGTALHSFAMPVIRYRLNDLVTVGPQRCPCGLEGPTLSAIQGRVIEMFTLPSGRKLHPYSLVVPMSKAAVSWLRQYQIIQERVDSIRFLMEPVREPSPEEMASVQRVLRDELEESVAIQLELVSEIRPGSNGKHRPYYTRVKSGSA